jgi:glutamyl/glutaminyl-tRNA synthetase
VFDFDAAAAMRRDEVAHVLREPAARDVIAALARAIEAPLLDRDAFRAVANRVRSATGQKGKALFHPIRVALTGEGAGPELDQAVPAIDRGATLPPRAGLAKVVSSRERAEAFARAIVQGEATPSGKP